MSFSIEPSSEISHRFDFALLANARGYMDAVEVGVDMGVFARDFLSRWHGYWLIGIDPYEAYAEFPYDRTADLMVAVHALAPFHGRFRFVRMRSPEAVPLVRTIIKAPDFVYIDGSHEEEDVAADLSAWWEVLPEHGCIGGHDFDEKHPGVVSAVKRFARERGLVVRLTQEAGGFPPSYYMYKTEPSTLIVQHFRRGEEDNPHGPGRG